MIDSCLQFEIGPKTKEMSKKLGFKDVFNISSFKVLKEYDKDLLLSSIKSLKYDLILNLEDNPKFWSEGLAKLSGEKKVGVLLLFNKILNASSVERSRLLKTMRKIVKLCIRYNVPVVISSGARKEMEMRGKSELLAFACVIGMNGGQAKETLSKNPINYLVKEKLVYE